MFVRASNVVVQAGQGPGFEEGIADCAGFGDPGGEVVVDDGVAVAVDAEAVEVGFAWEGLLDVGLGLVYEGRGWPDGVEVDWE